MQFDIRPLTSDDVAEYHALRLRGLRESPEAFGSSYDEERDMALDEVAKRIEPSGTPTGRIMLGAFASGALVGVMGCVQSGKVKSRHKATVWGMYVAPEARGHGVGRAMLERGIEEARSWPNVDQLSLSVVERGTAARSLYLSVGFRPFGREVDAFRQDGHSDTVEYMTLDLRAHTDQ